MKNASILILIGFSALLAACPQSSPMEVDLKVVGEPTVGEVVDLVVTINSSIDAPETWVEISIPEEIQILEGATEFGISLRKNNRFEYSIKMQVMIAGTFPIAVYGFNHYPDADDLNGFGDGQTIYVISNEDSAKVVSREGVMAQTQVGPCLNCSTLTIEPEDLNK